MSCAGVIAEGVVVSNLWEGGKVVGVCLCGGGVGEGVNRCPNAPPEGERVLDLVSEAATTVNELAAEISDMLSVEQSP